MKILFRNVSIIGGLLLLMAMVACGSAAGPAPAEQTAAQPASAPAPAGQAVAQPASAPAEPAQASQSAPERPIAIDPQPEPFAPQSQPLPTPVPQAASGPAITQKQKERLVLREQGAAGEAGPSGAGPLTGGAPFPDTDADGLSDGAPPTNLPEGFNSVGGSATVNNEPYDTTFFQHSGVNPFIDTEDDHLSTFAVDVDTASFTVARRFIQDGHIPDPESIRVEEFVNFFDQGYARPVNEAFAIHMEGAPSPFGQDNHWLLRVGLQGKSVSSEERKDATLIFAIDVSGSMAREDRLELVKRSLRLLVNELRPTDEVGIVVYGSHGRVLLKPTSGEDRRDIMRAIDQLSPGGSTYVEQGLVLAYEMAARQVKPGRITQVILLSDGVGNVGETGADGILRKIRDYVDQGVTLTTVGVGMGNYNDILMERLANDGDGAYYYVDTLSEARRIFVDELTSTIQVIARDAKVQVDFNPQVVSRYRLLGYENRRVDDQDFRNDTVDAGEIGAGHSVTALYELKLRDNPRGPLGTVYLRYQDADTNRIVETNRSLSFHDLSTSFLQASPRFQFNAVVAEYAELLRESYWAQDGSIASVVAQAERVQRLLPQSSDAAEFTALVVRTQRIQARLNGQ